MFDTLPPDRVHAPGGSVTGSLESDSAAFALERVVVPTALGDVVVRRSTRRIAGIATVLLHGAAGSWTTWTPLLCSMGADALHDLVIPDLPGWGETVGPAGLAGVGVESLASVAAEVARASGYDHWRVVGHSMGGFVALELASREPTATDDVLVVSPTTFGARADRLGPLRLWTAYPALAALLQAMRLLAALGRRGRGLVRRLDRMGLLAPLTAPLFAPGSRPDRSVVQALASEVRPAAFVRAVACARRYDAKAAWSGIRCAVRLVHGDRDVFTGREDDARLEAVIPRLAVVTLPATGHFGHVEHPDLVRDALGL